MIEAVWIAFAFGLGLLLKQAGLPALIGYLGAGFALSALGERVGVGPEDSYVLNHIAHLGVLLLLFTVGLKLKVKNLVRPEVVGGSLLHFGISSALFLPAFMYVLDMPAGEAILLAMAVGIVMMLLVMEATRRAVGWVMMALQSARMGGLEVPQKTLYGIDRFLGKVARVGGRCYAYDIFRKQWSLAMTAEGLLCRQYLGWKRDDERMTAVVKLHRYARPRGERHVWMAPA